MHNDYREIFKRLSKSYYDDTFEKEVENILSSHSMDREKLAKIISILCGVNIEHIENYISNLKNAIKNYTASAEKVVTKLPCSTQCAKDGDIICEKSCPVNAIFRDPNDNNIYINDELCLDCGLCVRNCPSGSILDKKEFIPLAELLKSESIVIAAVAPAIMGQFGKNTTINQLRTAFKKLGFTDMVEVAFFADMLTLKEAVEYDHFVKDEQDFMITSCCCPMWVGMLKKVYNDLVKYVSPSVSPMIAAGRVLKLLNPNCKVVFVGPCIAKKAEAREKDLLGDIDFVLTFTELRDIFDVFDIQPENLEEDFSSEYASKGGRLYARTGGVSIAVSEAIEKLFPNKYKFLKTIQADGVKGCKSLLDKIKQEDISANFVEGMGCVGGCVGGPKVIIDPSEGRNAVNNFAENSSIKVSVDSNCMNDILSKININSVEDFKDKDKISIFEREFK